ncbi:MAG: hypothetical protein V3V99_12155 [candidate division Zixibacteria bacterium]
MEISIPSKKNVFIILFLMFWLAGWCFGEFTVTKQLLSGEVENQGKAFMLFWLAMWTVGGIFAIFIWFWNVAGREIIKIDGLQLKIKRAIFNVGLKKEYELVHIKDLRISPESRNIFSSKSAFQFWGFGGGIIAFDYGARTYRFGASIDEAEAKIILDNISARFNIDIQK